MDVLNRSEALNTRELEILRLISTGLSNSEIARKLNLSVETVKWYNKHIFEKLGVGNRSQAVAKANETGILAGPAAQTGRKASRPVHNLPAPATSFIGREKEIQKICQLVSASRLVTITGAGGVGKTRLSIQAAERLIPQFIDGIRWVSFAALLDTSGGLRTGRDMVAQAVARTLRVPEQADQSLLQGILDHLRDRQVLLILDNCEHLIEDCAALSERLMNSCPLVKLLVTSREALNIPGEKVWRLPSLMLPAVETAPDSRQLDQSAIYQSEAVILFVERTADVLPGYHPGVEDAPLIAHICRRLDGIPLAIELASARMSLLSLQEIADRLENRFSLLTGGHRTALPRHQTLRAAIEWSFDLLSKPEQVLFRRLSIFSGSFNLEAAEDSCIDPDLPVEDVLTLLGRLMDKSLVIVDPNPYGASLATRYRFLDTIRSFGRLKLDEAGETTRMQERLANYFVRLVEKVGPELLLENQVRWYKLLQVEMDNLRSVVDWSAESGQAEYGLRILGALIWFLWSHSSTLEGLDMVLNLLPLPSAQEKTIYRARALNTAGYLHWVLGEIDAASRNIQEALSILRPLEDKATLAWSLQLLGMVLTSKGDYDTADQVMKEGLSVSQQPGDYQTEVFAVTFHGDTALRQGDRLKARRVYEESVALLRSYGNLIFLAYPMRRLAYLDMEQNEITKAWDGFQQSFILNKSAGDLRAVAASLTGMAALAIRKEKPVLAAQLYGVVESRLESLSMNLLPADQLELNKLCSRLAALLDSETYAAAYAEGWEMDDEQAISLARELSH